MAKVIIKYKISSKNEKEIKGQVTGIKNNNIITYKDTDSIVNILLEKDWISIKRENDKMHLTLKLEDNKSNITNYFIKDLKFNFDVKAVTKRLEIKENTLNATYELYINEEYSDTFNYTLEWSDL